jgi:hypothetical protein
MPLWACCNSSNFAFKSSFFEALGGSLKPEVLHGAQIVRDWVDLFLFIIDLSKKVSVLKCMQEPRHTLPMFSVAKWRKPL